MTRVRKKVLVVDDDKDILEGISIILKNEGYRVETTPKGDETYQKVHEFKPDLILLDILMSGNDGRYICKRLTTQTGTSTIPVVMISAEPSLKKDSIRCGAKDFLAKPFETEDLLAKVAEYIDK